MSFLHSISLAALAVRTEPPMAVIVATGLTVVFGVLILLYFIISLEGVIFSSLDKKKSGTAKQASSAKPSAGNLQAISGGAAAAVVEPGIPAEIVAAISAAIAMMEGGSRYTIRKLTRADNSRSAWGNAASASYTEPF